jgi:hypothetical protein
VHITGWSRGLEVSGGGSGVVSHAGLVLLRHLADKTGLTGGLSRALATPRVLVHDRGQVTADLASAIADGARVISDFRVMSDQRELFGLVASVPTAWRTLKEIALSGARADKRITAANSARTLEPMASRSRAGRLASARGAASGRAVVSGCACHPAYPGASRCARPAAGGCRSTSSAPWQRPLCRAEFNKAPSMYEMEGALLWPRRPRSASCPASPARRCQAPARITSRPAILTSPRSPPDGARFQW